jgi:hypothetical protein
MKRGVSVSFWRQMAIFAKTVGANQWILSENFKNFKTRKKSYA